MFDDGLPFKGFMDTEDGFEFDDLFFNNNYQPLGGGSNSPGEDNNEEELIAGQSVPIINDGLNEEEVLEFFRENNIEEEVDVPPGTTTEMDMGRDTVLQQQQQSQQNELGNNPVESAQRNIRRVMKNLKEERKDIAEEFKKRYSKILNHIESLIIILDGMDSDISSGVIVGLLRNIIKNNSEREINTEINKLKNPVERRLDNID